MSWIWRARIDKRCCDVRDVEETVTKDTGSWRAIASGGGATLRLRKVAPVGGGGGGDDTPGSDGGDYYNEWCLESSGNGAGCNYLNLRCDSRALVVQLHALSEGRWVSPNGRS